MPGSGLVSGSGRPKIGWGLLELTERPYPLLAGETEEE
jgi:hypothetical protein